MSLYSKLARLSLVVESYALDGLERDVSSAFTRRTTIITLHGGGETGVGEDVTYDGAAHAAFQADDLKGRTGGRSSTSRPIRGFTASESASARLRAGRLPAAVLGGCGIGRVGIGFSAA